MLGCGCVREIPMTCLSFSLTASRSESSAAKGGVFCMISARRCNAGHNRIILATDSLVWESCASVAGLNQIETSFQMDATSRGSNVAGRQISYSEWIFTSVCVFWPGQNYQHWWSFLCLHFTFSTSSTHSQDPAYVRFFIYWRSCKIYSITLG